MPHSDQPPHAADGPGTGDPESVYHLYLTTDVRPAIRAASPAQMRGILRDIGAHLCHCLRRDAGGIPGLSPGRRQPWQVCQIGSGMRAGFQLYQHVTQAVAGSCLHALGFDPGRAAAEDTYFTTDVDPFLVTARQQCMRRTLLHLTGHLQAVLDDSDTSAQASADAAVPDELWEIANGVTAGIQLYRHAVRALAVHVLYYMWEGLGAGSTTGFVPFIPDIADPAAFGICPN